MKTWQILSRTTETAAAVPRTPPDLAYDLRVPTLLAIWGPKQGLRLDLPATLVLGRAHTADVQLLDEKVSREHCRIQLQEAQALITDLGSHNGTFVNGSRIPVENATSLNAGDEVLVGDSMFLFDAPARMLATRFGELAVLVDEAPTSLGPSPLPHQAGPLDPATLPALVSLGMALGATSSEEGAVEAVVTNVGAAIPCDRLFLLRNTSAGLRPLGGRSDDKVIPLSRALFDTVARAGRCLRWDQPTQQLAGVGPRTLLGLAERSVMVAPVPGPQGPQGFLYVDRKGNQAFSAAEAAMLGALASAVSAAHVFVPATTTPPASLQPTPPVGESPAFAQVLNTAARAARSDATVLITGETGTGKEELARFIHTHSARQQGPFVAINCGAIAESLAASELFGHEKGAFTGAQTTRVGLFEAADGGTLFLDEVGELTPALQVQLLRVVQERVLLRVGSTTPRPIDIRLVAATHRDLAAPASGFRTDLFYRLNVVPLTLPPLRDRVDDLPALTQALLLRISTRMSRRPLEISRDALNALAAWQWPGNVRELANVLERMLVLRAPGELGPLDADDVRAALGHPVAAPEPASVTGGTLAETVAALEQQEILRALQAARGVKSHAAAALGISRPTLDKKVSDLGIDIWAQGKGASKGV